MAYANGQIPDSVVSVVLASGTDENGYWEFRCTPAFAARWAVAKAYALANFGRTIFIRTGWNVYRPLFSQQTARRNACAQGNCNGASVAGYSSHGGTWNGRECLAVDVDPNGLSWDQVDQAMSAAGFAIQQITEAMSGIPGGERWHYIDFNAFGSIPAGFNSTPFAAPTPTPKQTEIPMDMTRPMFLHQAWGQFVVLDLVKREYRVIQKGDWESVLIQEEQSRRLDRVKNVEKRDWHVTDGVYRELTAQQWEASFSEFADAGSW